MKESNIQTYVQFYLEYVELNIAVKNDLSKQDSNLKNFGYIQITNGSLEDKPLFWDNLNFFISGGKKEFKKECKPELKEKGYNWRKTYKQIKILLKQAEELNLITVWQKQLKN